MGCRVRAWIQYGSPSDVWRAGPADLTRLPALLPSRHKTPRGPGATVKVGGGPPMLRSENGRPVTWIYVDSRGRDLQGLVQDIQRAIARDVKLPPSVSVSYTGQFEFLVRATERMKIVVPVTLAIIDRTSVG